MKFLRSNWQPIATVITLMSIVITLMMFTISSSKSYGMLTQKAIYNEVSLREHVIENKNDFTNLQKEIKETNRNMNKIVAYLEIYLKSRGLPIK